MDMAVLDFVYICYLAWILILWYDGGVFVEETCCVVGLGVVVEKVTSSFAFSKYSRGRRVD